MDKIYKKLLKHASKFETHKETSEEITYFSDIPCISGILKGKEVNFEYIQNDIVYYSVGYYDIVIYISFKYDKNIRYNHRLIITEDFMQKIVDFNLCFNDEGINIIYKNPDYDLTYEYIMNNHSYFGGILYSKSNIQSIELHKHRVKEIFEKIIDTQHYKKDIENVGVEDGYIEKIKYIFSNISESKYVCLEYYI